MPSIRSAATLACLTAGDTSLPNTTTAAEPLEANREIQLLRLRRSQSTLARHLHGPVATASEHAPVFHASLSTAPSCALPFTEEELRQTEGLSHS